MAAATLHGVAFLAVMPLEWRISSLMSPAEIIPVFLVVRPEPQPEPAETAPQTLAMPATLADGGRAPTGNTELTVPFDSEDASHLTSETRADETGRSPPNTNRSLKGHAADAYSSMKKSAKKTPPARPLDVVAVYDVLVDPAGNIRDIALTRSSGVQSFDEAGKKMIYDDMTLLPSSDEVTVLRVTLHFSHEGQ